MKTQILSPIKSMNPIFIGPADTNLFETILKEHNGTTLAEIKEDGYRVQVHKKGDTIKGFTRTHKPVYMDLFPELTESLQNLPDCILDCELAGYDEIGHNGFSSVKKRFRNNFKEQNLQKYLNSGVVDEFPINLRVFDTLNWEGNCLLQTPLENRRNYTEGIDEKRLTPSNQRKITNSDSLESWFSKLSDENYEGLVCKNPLSEYMPGSRTRAWIKVKKNETLDLVVLGIYYNKKKTSTDISQILCGTYNPNTTQYETLGKINAKTNGLKNNLKALLESHYTTQQPSDVTFNPKMFTNPEKIPDFYVPPTESVVVEVSVMNLNHGKNYYSCGLNNDESYSLRIGKLNNLRLDKSPNSATTTKQVAKMYKTGQ